MEVNLHNTTDAAVWAREFCKRWPSALCQIEGKEGVDDGDSFEGAMIGWFANAIMAGVDSERSRIEALTADNERLQARVAELMEAVVILQNHLENTLEDDAWDKIPVSIWNNVGREIEAARAALKETGHD